MEAATAQIAYFGPHRARLRAPLHAGRRIEHRHRVAGEVHEQLLRRPAVRRFVGEMVLRQSL